jgi:hypothetical protein
VGAIAKAARRVIGLHKEEDSEQQKQKARENARASFFAPTS